MGTWPKYPVIYFINTWVWLQELGKNKKNPVTLATVPKKEWDAIADLNVDAVWFMGVWERSPAGIAVAMGNQGLLDDFRRALPDFTEADNVGSPYRIQRGRRLKIVKTTALKALPCAVALLSSIPFTAAPARSAAKNRT